MSFFIFLSSLEAFLARSLASSERPPFPFIEEEVEPFIEDPFVELTVNILLSVLCIVCLFCSVTESCFEGSLQSLEWGVEVYIDGR